MAAALPLRARALHIHREDEMRHVAGMHERHHFAAGQEIVETQMPIAPGQRLAAGADDQPTYLMGDAVKVDRLHEPQLDERVGTRQHGQPGDLGA